MATATQKKDHVNKVRIAATNLLEVHARMKALRADWDYLGLSGTLTEEDCGDLPPEAVAAVYNTLAAVDALLAAGHGTNLAAARVG